MGYAVLIIIIFVLIGLLKLSRDDCFKKDEQIGDLMIRIGELKKVMKENGIF